MISVITPSIRKEGLDMVSQCLKKQTKTPFEWLIVGPEPVRTDLGKFILEPPKKEGDFYCLNKAWNKAYQAAKGELIVNIVDYIWFSHDTLEKLWWHYQANPKALVTTVGHQYREIVNGKPEYIMWQDPRARMDQGSFYEVAPSEMEMCLASIPRQAILDCGGLDEIYDTCPAVSEKEMCWRLDDLGYKFYIDQSIEYRALHHDRIKGDLWDKLYFEKTTPLFTKHMEERNLGKRNLNVGFVKA